MHNAMKINTRPFNLRGLNLRGLNGCVPIGISQNSAYGGYVKDGLIFQLDCKKGIKTVSDCDDAARANWGGDWRIPTKDEWQELIDNCTMEYGTDGFNDYLTLTGPNGYHMELPLPPYKGYSPLYDSQILGCYHTSTISSKSDMKHYCACIRYDSDGGSGDPWLYFEKWSMSSVLNIRPVCNDDSNGRGCIDLGLPSGTKWAKVNIGLPEAAYTSYGNYLIAHATYDGSNVSTLMQNAYSDNSVTTIIADYQITTWTDLIQKAICEGTTTFETTAGVVFDGENYFVNPYSPEDEVVVEIAEKSGEELETTYAEELATNIGEGYTGTIYEIRVYLKSAYTDETKAKNALIDQNRFGDAPANALVDADGTYLLDKDGYYIISND